MLLIEAHATELDADKLAFYTVMAHGPGWGQVFPEMLRNADWNDGIYTPEFSPRAGGNPADCLACHKPPDKANCLFSNDALSAAAKR